MKEQSEAVVVRYLLQYSQTFTEGRKLTRCIEITAWCSDKQIQIRYSARQLNFLYELEDL